MLQGRYKNILTKLHSVLDQEAHMGYLQELILAIFISQVVIVTFAQFDISKGWKGIKKRHRYLLIKT